MLEERLLWMILAFITLYISTSTLALTIIIAQNPLVVIKELAEDPIVLIIWILIALVNIPLWDHLITTYPF